MLAISQILDFKSRVTSIDLLSVHVEVHGRSGVLDFHIEDNLLSLYTLFEISHTLLETVVIFNF